MLPVYCSMSMVFWLVGFQMMLSVREMVCSQSWCFRVYFHFYCLGVDSFVCAFYQSKIQVEKDCVYDDNHSPKNVRVRRAWHAQKVVSQVYGAYILNMLISSQSCSLGCLTFTDMNIFGVLLLRKMGSVTCPICILIFLITWEKNYTNG